MNIPTTIAFEGVPESDAVQQAVRRHAGDLERFYDRITSCHVAIAKPNRRRHKGDLYCVRIDVTVPGREIIVNREHGLAHGHEDVFIALRDAFNAARRQLEDHVRMMRGQVKAHPAATRP
jgi:ribosome-associated translation inhibitor RaiA